MKFATSSVMDRPVEMVRDNIARAEEYLQPKTPLQKMDPITRAKFWVRNFPMTAVFTAFAGGLLIGAAAMMSRRPSLRDFLSLDLSEPVQRGGRMISDTMEAAGQALRDGSDSMRSMVRRDMNLLRKEAGALRKEAGRWQRRIGL